MQMFCAQAAYHQSTDQLFATHSLLKDKPLMSKERFTELWKVISVKYRVPNDEVFKVTLSPVGERRRIGD